MSQVRPSKLPPGGGTLSYPNTSYITESEQLVLDTKPDNQFSLTFKIPTVEQLDEVFTNKYGYDEEGDNTKPLYLYVYKGSGVHDYYTPEEYWVNFGIVIPIIRIFADNLYPFNEAHCKKILIDGKEFYNRTRASWSLYRSVYVKPDTEHTVTYVMTDENGYDLATSISDIIDINGEKNIMHHV